MKLHTEPGCLGYKRGLYYVLVPFVMGFTTSHCRNPYLNSQYNGKSYSKGFFHGSAGYRSLGTRSRVSFLGDRIQLWRNGWGLRDEWTLWCKKFNEIVSWLMPPPFFFQGEDGVFFFISCSFLCRSLGSMVIRNLEETHPISTAGGGHLRDGNISSCKCRGGDVKSTKQQTGNLLTAKCQIDLVIIKRIL